jgi:hypothetical protein
MWEEAVYFVYSWMPSSVRMRGSDCPERIMLSGLPRRGIMNCRMWSHINSGLHVCVGDNISYLLAKEDNYAIDHATEAAIHKLISAGNLEELWDLMLWMKIGDSTEFVKVRQDLELDVSKSGSARLG